MNGRLAAWCCTACLLLAPAAAQADVMFGVDREIFAASSHSSYRIWKIEDANSGESRVIRQASSRLSSTFVVGENVDLLLYTSGGFSQDRTADNADLSGLGDLKLKSYIHTWQRRLVLGVGVNLPTGRTALTEEEVRVATVLAPHVLGFRLRNYGTGFDLDLGAAMGGSLTDAVTVGGGVSALVRGAYDLDEFSEYKPGHEFALTLGVDAKRDGATAVVDVVYRMFATDEVDGVESFEEGDQFEITALGSLRGQRWGVDALLKDVIKSDNEFLTELPPGLDNRVANGNHLWIDVAPRYQSSERWALKGLFDLVLVGQSQQQDTSAWAMGFGVGAEVRLTPEAIADLRLARLTGGSEDDSLDLSGWDTTLAMRWQY